MTKVSFLLFGGGLCFSKSSKQSWRGAAPFVCGMNLLSHEPLSLTPSSYMALWDLDVTKASSAMPWSVPLS